MDDKLFVKNEKELETLIQAETIYSQDIGMEFGMEKRAMWIMRRKKWQINRRTRTTKSRRNQKAQRKGNLEILGNIGSRHHQTSRIEIKN